MNYNILYKNLAILGILCVAYTSILLLSEFYFGSIFYGVGILLISCLFYAVWQISLNQSEALKWEPPSKWKD